MINFVEGQTNLNNIHDGKMVILDNTDNALMSSKYLKLNHVRIIFEEKYQDKGSE